MMWLCIRSGRHREIRLLMWSLSGSLSRQEDGRSAFAVSVGEKNLVLDYGVMVNHHVGFPMHIPPKEVEAIVLTHAHLDHVGSAPIFYIGGGVPLFGVQPTFTLTSLIIKD